MSWSVTAIGKPGAVKAALAKQFSAAMEGTKNIPHECASVGLAEQMVNGQLDFLADIPGAAVTVSANGSAYKTPKGDGSTQVAVSVMPLYGFVE